MKLITNHFLFLLLIATSTVFAENETLGAKPVDCPVVQNRQTVGSV